MPAPLRVPGERAPRRHRQRDAGANWIASTVLSPAPWNDANQRCVAGQIQVSDTPQTRRPSSSIRRLTRTPTASPAMIAPRYDEPIVGEHRLPFGVVARSQRRDPDIRGQRLFAEFRGLGVGALAYHSRRRSRSCSNRLKLQRSCRPGRPALLFGPRPQVPGPRRCWRRRDPAPAARHVGPLLVHGTSSLCAWLSTPAWPGCSVQEIFSATVSSETVSASCVAVGEVSVVGTNGEPIAALCTLSASRRALSASNLLSCRTMPFSPSRRWAAATA